MGGVSFSDRLLKLIYKSNLDYNLYGIFNVIEEGMRTRRGVGWCKKRERRILR